MTQRTAALVGYLMMGLFLAVIAYLDLKEKKIHVRIVLAGMVVNLLSAVSMAVLGRGWMVLVSSAAGFLSAASIFAISRITKGSVGEGDALVFAMCGIWYGFVGNLVFIWMSFFVAMICGGVLLAVGKANRKTRLPLVPFAFAAWLVMGAGFIGG